MMAMHELVLRPLVNRQRVSLKLGHSIVELDRDGVMTAIAGLERAVAALDDLTLGRKAHDAEQGATMGASSSRQRLCGVVALYARRKKELPTNEQLATMCGFSTGAVVSETMRQLRSAGKIEVVMRGGKRFVTARPALRQRVTA